MTALVFRDGEWCWRKFSGFAPVELVRCLAQERDVTFENAREVRGAVGAVSSCVARARNAQSGGAM